MNMYLHLRLSNNILNKITERTQNKIKLSIDEAVASN